MTQNTFTTQKTPHTGDLSRRCSYLPESGRHLPVSGPPQRYAPAKPTTPHNPLHCRRQENFETNISAAFKTRNSVAYTQSWDEYHKGLFSYYLYDHLGRPVETGQAKITHIRTGDQDKTLLMTNAHISEHVHSLSNRLHVMVAIYKDADTLPGAPHSHLNDEITTICYYPCVHASTPRSADGQYYPADAWYAAEYEYVGSNTFITANYQCTAVPVAALPSAEPPAAETDLVTPAAEDPIIQNPVAGNQQPDAVPITAAIPSPAPEESPATAIKQAPGTGIPTPVSRNYNCPVKNINPHTLQHICHQAFTAFYRHHPSLPGSFAACDIHPGADTLAATTTTFTYYPHLPIINASHYCNSHHSHAPQPNHPVSHRGGTPLPQPPPRNILSPPRHYSHSPPPRS